MTMIDRSFEYRKAFASACVASDNWHIVHLADDLIVEGEKDNLMRELWRRFEFFRETDKGHRFDDLHFRERGSA